MRFQRPANEDHSVIIFSLSDCLSLSSQKSIQVIPFTNQTPEPRLGDAFTSALRKEVQRDGTFTLATRNAGDIVVNGVITKYQRRAVSFVSTDIATARDYDLTLTAQVTARERGTGQVLFDKLVTSLTLIRVSSDLASTEPLPHNEINDHLGITRRSA